MIIGIYMIIPIVRKIIENKSITEYFLSFATAIIFMVLGRTSTVRNIFAIVSLRDAMRAKPNSTFSRISLTMSATTVTMSA